MDECAHIGDEHITAGMSITVLEWIDSSDCSYVGKVLRVVAVSMPFIAVRVGTFREPVSLDTRRIKCAVPTRAYVEALSPGE